MLYAKEGLLLISLPSVFGDESEKRFMHIAREHDPQDRESREKWQREGMKETEGEAIWSATIDYGDGRSEEIHFLWVSRPPRSE